MISRDGPQRRFEDSLDVAIRWVLRESVADARPPRGIWKQINERLVRRSGMKGVAWRRGFRLAAKAVALWLLDTAAGPPVECSYPREIRRLREKYYLSLLVYQYDLPMLLGQAM
jgi:hypothetical protein